MNQTGLLLTPEQIDQLSGRELDAAVTTQVFGKDVEHIIHAVFNGISQPPEWCYKDTLCVIPLYHSDGGAMISVLEDMKRRGFSFGCWDVTPISSVMPQPLAAFSYGVYPPNRCSSEDGGYYAHGDTLPTAVARAALKVVMGDGEKIV